MQLGIVVIDDQNLEPAVALLDAALARGWQARCFLTDRGVLLLQAPAMQALLADDRLHVSVCEMSIERHAAAGASVAGLEQRVIVGGQYQNAELVRHCDHVLTL